MLRTEKGRRKGTESAQRDKPLDGSRADADAPSQDNSHIKGGLHQLHLNRHLVNCHLTLSAI